MAGSADRIAVGVGAASLLALALGLAGQPRAFSAAAVVVVMLPLVYGWSRRGSLRPVYGSLTACALLYIALLLATFALDRPDEPSPRLFWGFPEATAVFVYLIWPLGALPALLYGLRFPREVLPEQDLTEFLARYSKRRSGDRRAADRHGA
ncbi:MAG: hypothetical protein GC160_18515 [Acidobacteria bacterium]|nr:hypothetical protein [Acidobacteriota bacterium]